MLELIDIHVKRPNRINQLELVDEKASEEKSEPMKEDQEKRTKISTAKPPSSVKAYVPPIRSLEALEEQEE